MASEKTISDQRKSPSHSSPDESCSDISVGKEHPVDFFGMEVIRGKAVEDMLFDHSSVDNISIGEEKLRLNILRLFIEYFCIEKRVPLKEFIKSVERMVIIRVLSRFNGNQKKAAKFLGMKHTTFNEKVRRHNIRIQKRIF